ncbi:SseB family protein [Agromyces aerolatus]|uniref:SseB family protein n=1 Tax=Agromyces sp. LY-1074 TaxID=3074080 RepID=UPI00286459F3|nr:MULTISPECIES: SseB family protein [unclassified Agromyces]MDR5701005.1 SseB family protein [Agromyces sp. LY-1074]MDR5707645.1 SseB family protein [Agromyces sp. LY-1358]
MSQGAEPGPAGPSSSGGGTADSNVADSAGQPWAGRSFHSNPHAADDGRMPAELAAALERFAAGDGGQTEVVRAFAGARLLIPLVAELGDGGDGDDADDAGPHGLRVDKSQELSIVTVAGPDGRKVLPVFGSVEAMSRWNPLARPVPADGVRVALAAADDGTDLVVLDPGSPTEFVLRRPAVWAVARSLPWQPPFEAAEIADAFERSIGSELAVLGVELIAGDPRARLAGPELVVRLTLIAGLTRQELDATTARLARRWAEDDRIATGVDSLAVKLVGGPSA